LLAGVANRISGAKGEGMAEGGEGRVEEGKLRRTKKELLVEHFVGKNLILRSINPEVWGLLKIESDLR